MLPNSTASDTVLVLLYKYDVVLQLHGQRHRASAATQQDRLTCSCNGLCVLIWSSLVGPKEKEGIDKAEVVKSRRKGYNGRGGNREEGCNGRGGDKDGCKARGGDKEEGSKAKGGNKEEGCKARGGDKEEGCKARGGDKEEGCKARGGDKKESILEGRG